MGIKIYISGISGNKEVKKRQQRVLMILDSKNIKYDVVDIAEPGNEDAKEFMQNNAKSFGATIGDANPRSPLPPQIFNDDDYCGDYDQFDMANEIDEIEKFLKMPYNESDKTVVSNAELKLGNGEIINSQDKYADVAVDKDILDDAQEKLENDDTRKVTADVLNESTQEKEDERKEPSPVQDDNEVKSEENEKLKNGNAEEDGSEEAVET